LDLCKKKKKKIGSAVGLELCCGARQMFKLCPFGN
jgi:hypothetical protein